MLIYLHGARFVASEIICIWVVLYARLFIGNILYREYDQNRTIDLKTEHIRVVYLKKTAIKSVRSMRLPHLCLCPSITSPYQYRPHNSAKELFVNMLLCCFCYDTVDPYILDFYYFQNGLCARFCMHIASYGQIYMQICCMLCIVRYSDYR